MFNSPYLKKYKVYFLMKKADLLDKIMILKNKLKTKNIFKKLEITKNKCILKHILAISLKLSQTLQKKNGE